MATYLPYDDSVFLFRLKTLIIDGGTEVVRNIFTNRLNNLPLVTFLANEKATINRLRAQKIISKVQYDKLFPPSGQQPDNGDFDTTLLMCLLRSIPSLGLNMTYPWYTSPAQTDLSIEADLIRLRTFKNEIAHASSTHCLDELTYKQQWNKVSQCLLRLNSGPHSDPNLRATIDRFKNSPLDPATGQRLDTQWQELENFLDNLEEHAQNVDTKLSPKEKRDDVSSKERGNEQDSNNGDLRCCDFVLWVLTILVIILTVPFALCLCIKEVQEYKRDVIFQLGRLLSRGAKEPGAQDEGSGSISEYGRNRVRDLNGEENTSERNGKMLENVRQKEDAGRMASQLRLDEERYRNWVRGATGLKFVHEGLKDTVGTTSRNHRDQELQNILSTLSPPSSANQCSLCTSDNLLPEHAARANRPCNKKTCLQSDPSKCFGSKPTNRRRCPNGICSKLYDGIVCAHQYKDPMWRNTDPTTWCSDIQGWSFGGKCYQTTPNFGQSADETDAAGLLSVILNNTYFQTDIACNLAVKKNSFAQARDIRNDILHSPKMELEYSQLQRYLDVFINVLQDKKKLFNDAKAKESVNKLVELKNNQITISMSEQISLIQMRKDALCALEQLQEKQTEVIKSLEEKKTEVLTAVDSAVASAIGTLELDDLHKRLKETEEAMKILTLQQKKPSNSVESSEVEEPAISESKYNIRIQKKDIGEVTGDVSKVKGEIVLITRDVDKASENVCEMEGGNGRIGGKVDNLEEQVQNCDTELSLNQQRREDVSQEESAQDAGSGPISECGRKRVRDLKGEENMSEKKRKMLEKVRQKEDAGRMAGRLSLENERCNNWVRGAIGLNVLHEGLKDTVGTTSRSHRDRELQNILSTPSSPSSATQCSLCTSHNLLPEHAALANRPCNKKTCLQSDPSKCFGSNPKKRRRCPNGICSKLYDGIVLAHRYKDPMWRNTDPTTWCSDVQGWSFGGKCYQTTPNFGKSADETDDAGLLSVILNNTYFQADIACNLAASKNSFAMARDISNDILHSPKKELEDHQLERYLDVFINVLQDKKKLFNDAKAKESVNKLVELKNNQITISMSEDISLIQMNKDALSARLTETEKALKILTDTVQQMKTSNTVESRVVEEPAISESKYNIRVQKLQEDLIDSYRSYLSKMNLAPLDKGTPLLQFYQMPDLERVTENIELGRAAKEVRTPVDTWNKLFHDSNHANYRSIYICADTGLGKTIFSKYLALTWCQSKEPLQEESQFFKLEHLEAIGEFRFVFLLFLHESGESKCHLIEMIWEQLVSKLIPFHELKDLENILRNEKCLIILDGLDEWIHPPTCGKREQVPHWSKRENVAVVTTTRPWTFSVAGLKPEQVDLRIELTGLNQNSAYNLKYSFMSYFKMLKLGVKCLGQQDKDEVSRNVQKFTNTVSDKHATKLESVPLMLMYMLFLDLYGFNLRETQCDFYCQIIELLLSRAFEEKMELVTSTKEKIPLCFNNRKYCLKFYNHFLKPLGELAFKTLLEEKREENTLVFDSSVAIKCLGEECFKQCLKTGIISQNKCVQTHPLIQKSTVSFSHKTMQDFFAALYMYSAPDDTRMSQLVLSKCKNVQDILDMSELMMFISGMNGNVAALISHGMMDIINEDEITQKYRNTKEIVSPLRDLQNMFISCCKEMQCASGDNLYIQDVFIDRDYEDEQYCVNLKQLIQHNKNNIKSVYINMEYMEDCTPYNSVQKVVEYFELKDLKNIVKIYCLKGKDKENIIPVLNTQVKCLELVDGSWSRSLCEKVTSLQKLEVIYINDLTMSHSELRLLYDFISQKVDMRHIELQVLNCSDHKWRSCSDLSLDLAQHSQLRKLTLWGIPLSELNINMTPLARCALRVLSLSSLVFTHGTCDTVNSELNKSDVSLDRVTIPASGLKDLVTVIQIFPHTVCVEIEGCGIKPESEWETLKQQIKTSPHFIVLEENDSWSKFSFETIKHGN